MQKDMYEKIISFLLGASWAIVLFGALITFKFFIMLGFVLAIFATLLYIVLALFLILTLDAFMVNKERLREVKKQTQLLEKIYVQHTK
jgi:membrane protein implicated in regulation of membrane protease activity